MPSQLYGATLVNGLGGPAGFGEFYLGSDGVNTAGGNDDDSSPPISIASIFGSGGLNFFGQHLTQLHVNNNGNITFLQALSDFTPQPIGTGLTFPIIAPFWMDIDTTGGPVVERSSPGNSTGSNLVYWDIDTTNRIFTVTWDDVGYFAGGTDYLNAFQLRLVAVGTNGDFDIVFIYEDIQIDAGELEQAEYNGGVDQPAHAGYFSPQGGAGQELPQSGTHAMLDLDILPGNTGQIGYYVFQVRNGLVINPPGNSEGNSPSPPLPPAPPPPSETIGIGVTGPTSQPEGDIGATPFVFTFHREGGNAQDSVVAWQILIDDPNDLAPEQALTGAAVIRAGENEATVTVNVQGERVFEADETFTFRITAATYGDVALRGSVGASVVSIIQNDDAPVTFAGPLTLPEGRSGATPFDFAISRSGSTSDPLTVNWAIDPATATANDFAGPLTGSTTFAAGSSSAVIRVMVAGDSTVELDETFGLRITGYVRNGALSPTDVRTTATILDDDSRPTLLVASPAALAQAEGNAGATVFNFTVTRVGDISGQMTTPFQLTLGSASGSDFLSPLSGSVSFAAGASEAILAVTVAGDTLAENAETFTVSVGGGALNVVSVSGIILNDDKAVGVAAPVSPGIPAPEPEVSSFMAHLAGGWTWSDGLV